MKKMFAIKTPYFREVKATPQKFVSLPGERSGEDFEILNRKNSKPFESPKCKNKTKFGPKNTTQNKQS